MNMTQPPKDIAPAPRRGLFARFARSRKGVAAVEFAMVSIPLLGLICAIFETAFIFFTQEAFDNAVSNVARQVLINSFQSNSTPLSSAFLQNSFCPQVPSFINCANVVLNIGVSAGYGSASPSQNWSSSSTYTASTATVNLGQPGQIVVFQAFYPMPVYLSVLTATGMGGGSVSNLYSHASNTVYSSGTRFVHAIYSTAVFRNEP